MKKLALVTSASWPLLTPDDRSLVQPLAAHGIEVQTAIWTDPTFDWSSCDGVIVRSCWDYHLKFQKFLDWISAIEQSGVKCWNQPKTLRWNANKGYLRDLERKGIAIVPTTWPDASIALKEKLRDLGWAKAVIKPRISATAHRTLLASAENLREGQALLDELAASPGVMVQKFMENVRTQGEWSLVYFDRKFSHAVLKTPKDGDFRVQHDFGGNERSADPPEHVLKAANRVIAAVEPAPLYARVDGVDDSGKFLLMELELIEPALFLTDAPGAPNRFADAIVNAMR